MQRVHKMRREAEKRKKRRKETSLLDSPVGGQLLIYLTKFELSRNATNQPRKFFPLSSMRFHAYGAASPSRHG